MIANEVCQVALFWVLSVHLGEEQFPFCELCILAREVEWRAHIEANRYILRNVSAKGGIIAVGLVIREWIQQECAISVDWGNLHSEASTKLYSDYDILSFKIFSTAKENL